MRRSGRPTSRIASDRRPLRPSTQSPATTPVQTLPREDNQPGCAHRSRPASVLYTGSDNSTSRRPRAVNASSAHARPPATPRQDRTDPEATVDFPPAKPHPHPASLAAKHQPSRSTSPGHQSRRRASSLAGRTRRDRPSNQCRPVKPRSRSARPTPGARSTHPPPCPSTPTSDPDRRRPARRHKKKTKRKEDHPRNHRRPPEAAAEEEKNSPFIALPRAKKKKKKTTKTISHQNPIPMMIHQRAPTCPKVSIPRPHPCPRLHWCERAPNHTRRPLPKSHLAHRSAPFIPGNAQPPSPANWKLFVALPPPAETFPLRPGVEIFRTSVIPIECSFPPSYPKWSRLGRSVILGGFALELHSRAPHARISPPRWPSSDFAWYRRDPRATAPSELRLRS